MITVPNVLFTSLFSSSEITLSSFLICMAVALVLGAILAFVYMYRNNYTKSFVITLALLPAIVSTIIMLVSGNLGAGVAVAGTFSLVRFRSAPGTAREICSIFLTMAAGLALGMGYIGFAVVFVIVMVIFTLIYNRTGFGSSGNEDRRKELRITIPEDLDYGGVFDDIFKEYVSKWRLVKVKTVNMGSLYRLTYDVTMKSDNSEKAFIDKLRCRNGNLEISSSLYAEDNREL